MRKLKTNPIETAFSRTSSGRVNTFAMSQEAFEENIATRSPSSSSGAMRFVSRGSIPTQQKQRRRQQRVRRDPSASSSPSPSFPHPGEEIFCGFESDSPKKKSPGLLSKLFTKAKSKKGTEGETGSHQQRQPQQDTSSIVSPSVATPLSTNSSSPKSSGDLTKDTNEVLGTLSKQLEAREKKKRRQKELAKRAASNSQDTTDFLGSLLVFPVSDTAIGHRTKKKQSFSNARSSQGSGSRQLVKHEQVGSSKNSFTGSSFKVVRLHDQPNDDVPVSFPKTRRLIPTKDISEVKQADAQSEFVQEGSITTTLVAASSARPTHNNSAHELESWVQQLNLSEVESDRDFRGDNPRTLYHQPSDGSQALPLPPTSRQHGVGERKNNCIPPRSLKPPPHSYQDAFNYQDYSGYDRTDNKQSSSRIHQQYPGFGCGGPASSSMNRVLQDQPVAVGVFQHKEQQQMQQCLSSTTSSYASTEPSTHYASLTSESSLSPSESSFTFTSYIQHHASCYCENEETILPQQRQRNITVAPGMSLPLRGTEETLQYIACGEIASTACLCCCTHLHCVNDADYIVCPTCRSVGPLEGVLGQQETLDQRFRLGSVALGFTTQDWEDYKLVLQM